MAKQVEKPTKKEIPNEFTGIWIPAAIYRFPELDSLDREIIGCINGFNHGGKKFISVSYIARLTGMHRTNVSKRVSTLVKNGFLSTKDSNSKRGGSNVLIITQKCLGLDLNDYEDELEPNSGGGSKGGCSGDSHPVAPALHPVAEIHTNNKKIINTRSSKRDEAAPGEFDFDLVLLFVMNTFRDAGYDVDEVVEKAFITEKLKEYQAEQKKPTKSGALSHIDVGLQGRHGTKKRSAKNAAARDKLADSTAKRINAQAAVIDQHTRNMQPRSMADRASRSWDNGLELLEEI